MNPSALSETGVAAAINLNLSEFGHDENTNHYFLNQIKYVFITGKPREFILTQADETTTKYMDWRLYSESDNSGRVKSVFGISRDVSQIKKAEENLKQSLEEKNVLLRELYHRTKNNMFVICSLLGMKAAYSDDPAIKETFMEIENKIQ